MKHKTGIKRVFEGIEQEIVIERYQAIYPYAHTVTRVIAEPTTQGRKSNAYYIEKRNLGDDWISDLTDCWFEPGTLRYEDVDKIDNLLKTL